jgi:hypothetical protein
MDFSSGITRREIIRRYESVSRNIVNHFFKVCFVGYPESKRGWCVEIATYLSLLARSKTRGFKIDREFIDDYLGDEILSPGYIGAFLDSFRIKNPEYEGFLENVEDVESAYKKWVSLIDLFEEACNGVGYVDVKSVMRVMGVK